MRSRLVLSLWVVCTLVAPPSALEAQDAAQPSPASLERIRAALQREPSRLQLPVASDWAPTFHVEVRERLYDLTPVREEHVDPTYGLPSIGELLMGGLAKIQSAVVNHKHRLATRRARREVDDALAAFCAARECPPAATSR